MNREETRKYMRDYYLRTSTRPRMIPGATRQSKVCPRCKIDKPRADYSIVEAGKRKGHLHGRCKTCNATAARIAFAVTRDANPEKHLHVQRKSRLKKYGLTPEDYAQKLIAQNNSCEICGTKEAGGRTYKHTRWVAFSVDHCHATGKVRGLLCRSCNTMLGLLQDNVDLATRAINYLEKYKNGQ